MPTKAELDKAIDAVKAGVASRQQQEDAARAAKQAGSTGNRAREAFRK